MANECPTSWDEYFLQPDGVLKCTLESVGAPSWTIVVVGIVFCFLAWRDFAKKRREEAGRVAAAARESTSWMARTAARIGFHSVLLIVGGYLVARIGAGYYAVVTPESTMAEILGTDIDGSVRLPAAAVWSLLGAALLAVLLVWSVLGRMGPLLTLTKGILGCLGYLSLLALATLVAMGLMSFFGWAMPQSRQLSYTYGTWILGWTMLAFAGLSLPVAADTLVFILYRNRPSPGWYGA